MKKKFLLIIISIISIFVFLSVYLNTTYSKFTATSDTKLSLEFVAEPTYTYYFQAPPDWGTNPTVYSYMWGVVDSTTVENAAYPGAEMECINPDLQIYSYTLSSELAYKTYGKNVFQNIIFSNGGSFSSGTIRKSIDLSVAGDMNGKIFAPEIYSGSKIRTISYGFSPCYIHYWGGTAGNTTWPGELVGSSATDSSYVSDKTYYILLSKTEHNNIIFNDGGEKYQTQDLTVPEYQDLTCVLQGNKSSVWRRVIYFGSWHTYSTWENEGYNNWYSNEYRKFVDSANAGY